ncbi:MAG: hypothetical protein EXR92_04180 [Gemmatimonadetes bacterium]|nr:hypothetical protein [Gemmatimonadota bacterium]
MVREFEDEAGVVWVVGVKIRPGLDFKGRYVFTARPAGTGEEAEVHLDDVRWNSERTAARTLQTMSLVELRRRLGWARGRALPSAETPS